MDAKPIARPYTGPCNKINETLKRFNDRIKLTNLRLIERYCNSETDVLAEVEIAGMDHQFVAHFQCVPGRRAGPNNEASRRLVHESGEYGRAGKIPEIHLDSGLTQKAEQIDVVEMTSCSREEQSVFINIVHAVDGPQIVPLPSLVRFDLAERFYSVFPQGLFYSSEVGFVTLGIVANQKSELPVCAPDAKIDQKQLMGQEIEGTPQMVKGLSGDHADSIRYGFCLSHVKRELARLRLLLMNDVVLAWVDIEKGVESRIKINQVLFGPFNFCPNGRKSFLGGHSL